MTPEVLLRKLAYLRQLLADLAPFANAPLAEVRAEHYRLERLFELLVVSASDVLFHQLAERGLSATSYRHVFKLAGEQGLLPSDLSGRLQEAAAMRNVIVHMYEEIDYAILRDSIGPALQDFSRFVALLEAQLEGTETG